MENKIEECVICRAPLRYRTEQVLMTCVRCNRTFPSNTDCVNGHFVCDGCHASAAMGTIEEMCEESASTDPLEIVTGLLDHPDLHMHGPEHHSLSGSALLAAYRNAGGDIDLGQALREMTARASRMPGGSCGLWGCCGAAVGCGMAYSIITGTTPLSGETWGKANILTSRCLEAVGSIGGPRCCKRDVLASVTAAAGFISDDLGVDIRPRVRPVCRWSSRNAQCLGADCPYNPASAEQR